MSAHGHWFPEPERVKQRRLFSRIRPFYVIIAVIVAIIITMNPSSRCVLMEDRMGQMRALPQQAARGRPNAPSGSITQWG